MRNSVQTVHRRTRDFERYEPSERFGRRWRWLRDGGRWGSEVVDDGAEPLDRDEFHRLHVEAAALDQQ